MNNTLAMQPIETFGLDSIRQVASQPLLSETSANSASPLDSSSSIVQLSPLGQVLVAGATLQNSLEALQANTTNTTPDILKTAAQAFVTAINNVQQSITAAVQGTGVPAVLLQDRSADAVLNNIQFENLDLANTLLAASTTPDDTNLATVLTAVAEVTPNADTLATPDVATSDPPVVTTTTTTTASLSTPLLPAGATVDRLSADQAEADATQALQVMMADSALRDAIFNPVASALSASMFLSVMVMPTARTRTGVIPAEIPGAVLPINRIEAINSYQDAARPSV